MKHMVVYLTWEFATNIGRAEHIVFRLLGKFVIKLDVVKLVN